MCRESTRGDLHIIEGIAGLWVNVHRYGAVVDEKCRLNTGMMECSERRLSGLGRCCADSRYYGMGE